MHVHAAMKPRGSHYPEEVNCCAIVCVRDRFIDFYRLGLKMDRKVATIRGALTDLEQLERAVGGEAVDSSDVLGRKV